MYDKLLAYSCNCITIYGIIAFSIRATFTLVTYHQIINLIQKLSFLFWMKQTNGSKRCSSAWSITICNIFCSKDICTTTWLPRTSKSQIFLFCWKKRFFCVCSFLMLRTYHKSWNSFNLILPSTQCLRTLKIHEIFPSFVRIQRKTFPLWTFFQKIWNLIFLDKLQFFFLSKIRKNKFLEDINWPKNM